MFFQPGRGIAGYFQSKRMAFCKEIILAVNAVMFYGCYCQYRFLDLLFNWHEGVWVKNAISLIRFWYLQTTFFSD